MTVKQQIRHSLFAHLSVTRWMFDQLRFEANAWLVPGRHRVLPGRRRAQARVISLFREAGFGCPAERGVLDSAIPRAALEQVDRRDRVVDGAGICVESRK